MANINSPSAKVVELKKQDQFDIWTSIKSFTTKEDNCVDPYVHPMLRRSASFMSQASLDSCTESLGSETGSHRFADLDDFDYYSSSDDSEDEEKEEEFGVEVESIGGSFPPQISYIRHREMRAQRSDGRLVLESVAVSSLKKSLCCRRQDGHLLLSFVDNPVAYRETEIGEEDDVDDDDEEEEEEEEEEEVEVVDRGIVVEVKMRRSTSFVINKFVGVDINTMEPEKPEDKIPSDEEQDIDNGLNWVPPEIMSRNLNLPNPITQKKVTVKKREAILEHMKKRCNMKLNRPLFILEPSYVAAAAT